MSNSTLQFVVATFTTPDGADFALARLKTAQIRRGNAAVIRRDAGGKMHIAETHDWGMGKSALLGGLVGIVLPGVGIAAGVLGGALIAQLRDGGFPDDALKRLGGGLAPHASALVILVEATQQTEAERVLVEAGGTPASGGLSADLADQTTEVSAQETS